MHFNSADAAGSEKVPVPGVISLICCRDSIQKKIADIESKMRHIHRSRYELQATGQELAATSLLFMLALLGDIEQKPPFYVLDEFDSALDEERKHEIFDLYRQEVGHKLIVVSPKVHGDRYLDRLGKFHCVVANPGVEPGRSVSEVYDVTREKYRWIRELEEQANGSI